MNLGSAQRSEDVRILKHEVLNVQQLIRLALRARLVDNFEIRAGSVALLIAGSVLELNEHDARIFLWGLIRGRERTLAQPKPNHAVTVRTK